MYRSLLWSFLFCGVFAYSSHAAITISGNNSAGARLLLASSSGAELPTGSAIRVGFFNDPVSNTAILAGSDYGAINAIFKPIGEGQVGGGTVSTGALSVNATPGRFSFAVNSITQTYAPQNTPIYFWVFNDAVPAAATEWAIFTNDDSSNSGSPWIVPFDDPDLGGSITMSVITTRVDDASDLVSGTFGVSAGGFPQIRTVPEPGLAALCLTAIPLFLRRRRS